MAASQQQSKSDRREAARQKAAEMREAQLKKEARVRRITLLSIVVGIALIAALVVVIVLAGKEKTTVNPNAAAPTSAVGVNDGIPFDASGAAGKVNEGAINVEVYFDFLCPWCAAFETTNQSTLDELRTSGDITLVMQPTSIFSSSLDAYGVRAASAFAYVSQYAPDQALAFAQLLFANQPEETGDGLTNDEISAYAEQAGVPADVATAAVSDEFGSWVINRTNVIRQNAAVQNDEGGFSTPTILIDGVKYEGSPTDADAFKEAVEAAVSAKS